MYLFTVVLQKRINGIKKLKIDQSCLVDLIYQHMKFYRRVNRGSDTIQNKKLNPKEEDEKHESLSVKHKHPIVHTHL